MRSSPGPTAVLFAIAVFALLQAVPAVLNGYPFVFFDSRGYFNSGEAAVGLVIPQGDRSGRSSEAAEGTASDPSTSTAATDDAPRPSDLSFARSPYYGVVFFLLFSVSPFAVVAAQALALAYLGWLGVRTLLPEHAVAAYLVAGVLCAAVTPLPYFAGYLTPDAFAAAVPLGVFLLAYGWRDLGRRERLAVWAILAASLLFHMSHILLAAGLVVLSAMAAVWPRMRPSGRGWFAAGAALAVAVIGVFVHTAAIRAVYGMSPTDPPYLTARGLEDGPVAAMIRAGCPEQDFAICAADPEANSDSQEFLWGTSSGFFATADIATRKRLSKEDFEVFLTAARAQPFTQIAASLRNAAEQFVMFGLFEFATAPDVFARSAPNYFPPEELAAFGDSRAVRGAFPFDALSLAIYAAAIASTAVLIALVSRGRLGPAACAALFVFAAALVLNAAAGGALSDAHHRYQARLIWLVPFLATALGFYALAGRSDRSL